ncbi:sulfurtransferase [Salinimonas marina]|uniref:Sulfurtransferase n=1 Tax=Salinimonas marina TaxID=2785918 RepID=A0A7S9HE97_9ALTE|nr:sulfurtransferase [Salinimonas marina]QPG06994.1 sulfurtransferase [Salinimonas marina]
MTIKLIEADTLAERLKHYPLAVLKATMALPGGGTSEHTHTEHLPDSQTIDLDNEGSRHKQGKVHQRLDTDDLARLVGKLGLTPQSEVVVYDGFGMFCAPRIWWMLKAIGHDKVRVLNGGLPAWQRAGGLTNQQSKSAPFHQLYQPQPQKGWFVDSAEVLAALNTETQIVDARSPARFDGNEPEPRAGVRSGHIPGSLNVYYQELLTDNRLRSAAELNAIFDKKNVNLQQPIICSCGSGITACIVGMAALICGAPKVTVYDGSWTEWGSDPALPVELSQ